MLPVLIQKVDPRKNADLRSLLRWLDALLQLDFDVLILVGNNDRPDE